MLEYKPKQTRVASAAPNGTTQRAVACCTWLLVSMRALVSGGSGLCRTIKRGSEEDRDVCPRAILGCPRMRVDVVSVVKVWGQYVWCNTGTSEAYV